MRPNACRFLPGLLLVPAISYAHDGDSTCVGDTSILAAHHRLYQATPLPSRGGWVMRLGDCPAR